MPKTDKAQVGQNLAYWIEYGLEPQPSGTWVASATGKIRYLHADGTANTIDMGPWRVHGRTKEQAIQGAMARANKRLLPMVRFIQEAQA